MIKQLKDDFEAFKVNFNYSYLNLCMNNLEYSTNQDNIITTVSLKSLEETLRSDKKFQILYSEMSLSETFIENKEIILNILKRTWIVMISINCLNMFQLFKYLKQKFFFRVFPFYSNKNYIK